MRELAEVMVSGWVGGGGWYAYFQDQPAAEVHATDDLCHLLNEFLGEEFLGFWRHILIAFTTASMVRAGYTLYFDDLTLKIAAHI